MNGETLESPLDTDPGKAQVADNLGPWMRQLAAALDAQHRAGFVHGDVKAANVLRRSWIIPLRQRCPRWREH